MPPDNHLATVCINQIHGIWNICTLNRCGHFENITQEMNGLNVNLTEIEEVQGRTHIAIRQTPELLECGGEIYGKR